MTCRSVEVEFFFGKKEGRLINKVLKSGGYEERRRVESREERIIKWNIISLPLPLPLSIKYLRGA